MDDEVLRFLQVRVIQPTASHQEVQYPLGSLQREGSILGDFLGQPLGVGGPGAFVIRGDVRVEFVD